MTVIGADRCAPTSARVGELMAGTAPEARAWLAVEQSGPWGRQALTESHLAPGFGAALEIKVHDTGVKPLLIRAPGRHADNHRTPEHRAVWLAYTAPNNTWMRRLDVRDLDEVLALDLAAAGRGVEPDVGVRDDEPLLLLCTNAKRDQCCAIQGRPAAHAAAAIFPGRVWECSHLGGHRFSATALLLPHGFVHGRLDADSATRVLNAAVRRQTDLSTLRGRSCWPTPGQAAEVHVRTELDLHGLADVLDVRTEPSGTDRWTVHVALADGSTPVANVRAVVSDDVQRAESCVKPAVPLRSYLVEDVAPNR